MNCTLHKTLPLDYFCQTCLDPICCECIKSNPHSNQFHKITSISEAVHNRREIFLLYVQNEINPLRQKIKDKLQQIQRLDNLQIESRNAILKDIGLEFQAIQHRTKEKAEKKMLECHTEIKYYQTYLNSLDDVAYTFDKTCSDPYNFLILYHDFSNQLKNLELKQVREKINNFQLFPESTQTVNQQSKVSFDPAIKEQLQDNASFKKLFQELNLPRQIKQSQIEVNKLFQLQQRNQFMNSLIGEAVQNYSSEMAKLNTNAHVKHKQRLHIFNKMNEKIVELKACKSCAFCQTIFTLEALNDQCSKNKSIKTQLAPDYSHIKVQPQIKGSKRHYWVDSSVTSRKVPDLGAHALTRITLKKHFVNSLKDLYKVKFCFRKYEIDHCKYISKKINVQSFMKVFQSSDNQKSGMLSKIHFKYLLTKTFLMNETLVDVLTQLLSYKWKQFKVSDKMKEEKFRQEIKQDASRVEEVLPEKLEPSQSINYTLLPQFLENPLYFYEIWTRIEEQIQKTKSFAPKTVEIKKGKYW